MFQTKINALITLLYILETCVSHYFIADFSEAIVRFPNEGKAKEFTGTLEGGDVVAKLLPSRKKKVEPMGGGYMDEGNSVVLINTSKIKFNIKNAFQ